MRASGRNAGLRGSGSALLALVAAAAMLVSSCTSWKSVARSEGWTLYAKRELPKDEERSYAHAIEPALDAVSGAFGPFAKRVSLYVWDGDASESAKANGSVKLDDSANAVQDVPGIGPARVRAFHAKTRGLFGPSSGVYLGAPETGTVVHELVHARLAEEAQSLPLWLEEGLACLMGDGYRAGDRWVMDGLSCWPLRELAEARLDERELARLLSLTADAASDVRQNVLAHFVGWAIVFDLYRESGTLDWRAWIARYGHGIAPAEAAERLRRTLAPATLDAWLARLGDAKPEVRIATAKGLWKLRSPAAVEAMLDRLEKEDDVLARVVLALNVLASAGEMRLPEDLQRRMWRQAWPALRKAKVDDASQQEAIERLTASFRWGSRQSPQGPLEALREYWAE